MPRLEDLTRGAQVKGVRTRPNEKFSGAGHARHVCRDCRRMSRAGGRARVAPLGAQAPSDEDPS